MSTPDTDPKPDAKAEGDDRSAAQVREDIERTREELGDTVEELAAKADVKAQAKDAVQDVKDQTREKVSSVKETVAGKADDLKSKAQETTPAGAQQGGEQLLAKVRENPQATALAGAAFVGFVIGRLSKS